MNLQTDTDTDQSPSCRGNDDRQEVANMISAGLFSWKKDEKPTNKMDYDRNSRQ